MHLKTWREPDGLGDYTTEVMGVPDDGDFVCSCDDIIEDKDDVIECDVCGEKSCRICFEIAKAELGGGIFKVGPYEKYSICYPCSEGDVKKLLEDLKNGL